MKISVMMGRHGARQDRCYSGCEEDDGGADNRCPNHADVRVGSSTVAAEDQAFIILTLPGSSGHGSWCSVDTDADSAMPTRCSTICSADDHVTVAVSTSGMTHLGAKTSISAGNNTLQGVLRSGVKTYAGYSTHVLSCPPDDPAGTHTLDVDANMSVEVLTHVLVVCPCLRSLS